MDERRWDRAVVVEHVPRVIEVSSNAVVGLTVIFFDIWFGGPLQALDLWLANWTIEQGSAWHGLASILDNIGLRGLTAPILVITGFWLRRRTGWWRPLWLVVFSILMLNFVVGSLKLAVGRGRPAGLAPDLFVGDMMWPSGHAANIAMTTALLVYLVRSYGHRPISNKAAGAMIAVPSLVMTTVSVALGYHWFSDLLAGTIVGLSVAGGVAHWDASHRSDGDPLRGGGSSRQSRVSARVGPPAFRPRHYPHTEPDPLRVPRPSTRVS